MNNENIVLFKKSVIVIYYYVWKQTIWLPLSSPPRKKVEKIYPRRDSNPGPRPQSKVFDALDRSAMIPLQARFNIFLVKNYLKN